MNRQCLCKIYISLDIYAWVPPIDHQSNVHGKFFNNPGSSNFGSIVCNRILGFIGFIGIATTS